MVDHHKNDSDAQVLHLLSAMVPAGHLHPQVLLTQTPYHIILPLCEQDTWKDP